MYPVESLMNISTKLHKIEREIVPLIKIASKRVFDDNILSNFEDIHNQII